MNGDFNLVRKTRNPTKPGGVVGTGGLYTLTQRISSTLPLADGIKVGVEGLPKVSHTTGMNSSKRGEGKTIALLKAPVPSKNAANLTEVRTSQQNAISHHYATIAANRIQKRTPGARNHKDVLIQTAQMQAPNFERIDHQANMKGIKAANEFQTVSSRSGVCRHQHGKKTEDWLLIFQYSTKRFTLLIQLYLLKNLLENFTPKS